MLVVGFFGYLYATGGNFTAAVGILKSIPYSTSSSYTLSVIPLFILMGQIIFYSGISSELFDTCYKWLGRFRGGLSIATIAASAGFSAICGSATATAATMGVVCYPEMKKYNYKDTLATGCVCAGGTLGTLIPPSIGFILYGTAAQIAVGKMFVSGIIPGVINTLFYIACVVVITRMDKNACPRGERFDFLEMLKSLKNVLPVIILFVIVLGGIFAGWFTATEGGAIGAFGAFMFMVLRRRASLENVKKSLMDTLKTSAMILFIIMGANVFNSFLTITNMPSSLAKWILTIDVSPMMVLILILALYAVLGLFVDSLPLIALLTPIFLPVIVGLGMDPIWFGVLMVMFMQLGSITPPCGIICFVMSGVAKEVPLHRIYLGTAYFIPGLMATVVLVLLFPALGTYIPSLM